MPHWAIFTETSTPVRELLNFLLNGPYPDGFEALHSMKGVLFSTTEIAWFIEEELRHDRKILSKNSHQSLQSMSSGERKKALFSHLLSQQPDYMILDNAFDNLDVPTREYFTETIHRLKSSMSIIQVLSRKSDLLPFIDRYATWHQDQLSWYDKIPATADLSVKENKYFNQPLPSPLERVAYQQKILIELRNVSVSYGNKPILDKINWKIKPGEFWELKGANGSGKTTLLSLITGDNPKGYGQELYLFGNIKGSGESVWDIKKQIGYITPALTDRFRGYHTIENMLISGLVDSIGLYIQPTDEQKKLAVSWLSLLGLAEQRDTYFHDLGKGQQRLIMCARAMIKQPLLLILDEPTSDLDDNAAEMVIQLVNKLGKESDTAIVFVSHREEPGLKPKSILKLSASLHGSVGNILK
ncbi:ATP-binding cassette domain-containing protein [uncultured Muriicola sp.]|uniref:ATP-binding cassette domain-containing protein n=1 Tax=uncultured Muriicola sp. TaxID=1583102 RepID=UPI00262531BC|nr:ATP-binding cassette domain-containing protein [uncultured Muriicola sp.]